MTQAATTVVNIRHATADVYCGRGQPLGNKYVIGQHGNRRTVIALFAEDFYNRLEADQEFKAYVLSLAGKRLGCHCHPDRCHLDIVADWINDQTGAA